MAVYNQVHMVFLEHIETCVGPDRLGGTEEDIRDVGTHHGTAPAIGQSRPHCAEHDIVHLLIHAHSRAVHHFHDLTVDRTGSDAQLFPDLLPFLGGPAQICKFAPLLTKLFQELESHLLGDLVHGFSFDIDAQVAGYPVQLAHVLDLEILGLALSHG